MDQSSVLVVEDELLVQMDIVDQLERAGFRVFAAFNAEAAIRILEAHPEIRLVFTDVDMPGSMDGLALAAFVRDRWPPIKIIVTSGYRKVETDQLPLGSPFFPKPYDPQRVITKMRDMMEPT